MTDVIFNPFDPEHFLDPHERMERVRQNCPVEEFAPGFVFIARDADVRDGFKSVSTYSNVGSFELEGSIDPLGMVQLDPPRHTQMRLMVQNGLNPKVFKQTEPLISRVATELVSQMASHKRADLMQTLAIPLPMIVISHLIGVPEEQRPQFCRWGTEIAAAAPFDTKQLAFDTRPLDCWQSFQDYLRQIIAEHRRVAQTPDDFITGLIQAEVEGVRLTDDEIRITIFQIVLAGSDPVSSLIGSLVYQLLHRPGLWQQGNERSALVPQAIAETQRHATPLPWLSRTFSYATEMQGIT